MIVIEGAISDGLPSWVPNAIAFAEGHGIKPDAEWTQKHIGCTVSLKNGRFTIKFRSEKRYVATLLRFS